MKITDAQIHLWTNDNASPHHWRAPFPVEVALSEMAEAGVDAVINLPPSWDDGANDYAVEAALQHPDKFASLGWFPLNEAANEGTVDAWMARPGMLGLRYIIAMPDIDQLWSSGKLDWLWSAMNARELPMGVFARPDQLPAIGQLAADYPKMRLLLDHLSVFPGITLPDATAHFDAIVDLAKHPNIAVKATAIPSMAPEGYPFEGTSAPLRKVFDAFGADRMFWGSDITRLKCSWKECLEHFTQELPWLKGRDLERVMGQAVRHWVGWA